MTGKKKRERKENYESSLTADEDERRIRKRADASSPNQVRGVAQHQPELTTSGQIKTG